MDMSGNSLGPQGGRDQHQGSRLLLTSLIASIKWILLYRNHHQIRFGHNLSSSQRPHHQEWYLGKAEIMKPESHPRPQSPRRTRLLAATARFSPEESSGSSQASAGMTDSGSDSKDSMGKPTPNRSYDQAVVDDAITSYAAMVRICKAMDRQLGGVESDYGASHGLRDADLPTVLDTVIPKLRELLDKMERDAGRFVEDRLQQRIRLKARLSDNRAHYRKMAAEQRKLAAEHRDLAIDHRIRAEAYAAPPDVAPYVYRGRKSTYYINHHEALADDYTVLADGGDRISRRLEAHVARITGRLQQLANEDGGTPESNVSAENSNDVFAVRR
ncbi:Uu.00g035410.m01.CDS01 [Anthostomella pinea]|uniref:Uu.00g035410.m01.CDS01 n=1 Tax=Anthostomella pinea TaxID=933095 RepID=A0AAI8YDL0_9PEZI|nr:Uu.00g035410.m01.CDS01 [Anthostomella pinea]